MADKRDYYDVLEVQKGATDDEIKKAFKKKARQYHPDLNPNNPECEEKFKEANEAFEILSDSNKRAKYDQFGHAGVDPSYGGGAGAGGFGGFGGGGFAADMSDILENIFGNFNGGSASSRSSANTPRRGGDVQAHIVIDFMEACFGCSKEIKVNKMCVCDSCKGTGSSGGETEICPDCQGRGQVKVNRRTAFGVISSAQTCPRCSGKGKIIKNPCAQCRGVGRVKNTKTMTVDIPAGIGDGQAMRLNGEGDCGVNNGPAGHLNLIFSVKPHTIFTRDGYDIYCEIPITYSQAVLGAEITVPTIDGNVKYSVGEGTQPGTKFRLKNKGVPKLRGPERGNQFVTVTVDIPKNLSKEQARKLKEFENSLTEKNYTKRESFFSKIKDLFN